MAFRAAQFRRFLVHHLHERFFRTRYMLCQCIRRFICRFQKEGVQAVIYRKNIPLFNLCIRGAGIHIVNRIMGEGHLLLQRTMFQNNKSGQDLRNTGRILLRIGIFCKKNRSGIGIHHDSRFRSQFHISESFRVNHKGRKEKPRRSEKDSPYH